MNEISAYTHLEHRFGAWARTYAVLCFLFTQIARIGSIFFGMALAIQALTGYSMIGIMLLIGICVLVYTVLGGMEAVIWTEVVQAILMTRSEEHTSELQSLMRISYAVFCLKKKIK